MNALFLQAQGDRSQPAYWSRYRFGAYRPI